MITWYLHTLYFIFIAVSIFLTHVTCTSSTNKMNCVLIELLEPWDINCVNSIQMAHVCTCINTLGEHGEWQQWTCNMCNVWIDISPDCLQPGKMQDIHVHYTKKVKDTCILKFSRCFVLFHGFGFIILLFKSRYWQISLTFLCSVW